LSSKQWHRNWLASIEVRKQKEAEQQQQTVAKKSEISPIFPATNATDAGIEDGLTCKQDKAKKTGAKPKQKRS